MKAEQLVIRQIRVKPQIWQALAEIAEIKDITLREAVESAFTAWCEAQQEIAAQS